MREPGEKTGVGIVHLGLGAFFRAFGLPWIAEAMRASGGDWGMVGVSLRSPDIRDALRPQGYAYTACELTPDGERLQVIDILQDVLVAPEDPEAVLAQMAHPDVRLVTLTVTEKGYCHNPATGALNPDNPAILADLKNRMPQSTIGYLVRALERRRDAGLRPFTVLSCDNLPDNGHLVRGVVLDLARRIDPVLSEWIEAEGCFPASMIDRIVPATKEEDVARIEAIAGYHDAAPVMHEPFRQWVVEDRFVDGRRPDLCAVDVQMVTDVAPFEHMKLRMLNGTHSSLAYLGYLAGHETISDCANDPVFEAFLRGLWEREIIPTLTPPDGSDLSEYAANLLKRYKNPAIRHRTWQIAMDGSQKLPQRILGTISDNIAAGCDAPGLALAVAAWMRYVGGIDERGEPIDVQDPLAAHLRAISEASPGVAAVEPLLNVRDVFPSDLAVALAPTITPAYERLLTVGAHKAVEELT